MPMSGSMEASVMRKDILRESVQKRSRAPGQRFEDVATPSLHCLATSSGTRSSFPVREIKERHAVQAEGLLTEIKPRHGQNPLLCVLETHRLHYTVVPGAGQSESAARGGQYARSMAIAPNGAESRMPITAVESTACPQLSPSASGTPPMAACTVALGR